MATRRCWHCDVVSHMTPRSVTLVKTLGSRRYALHCAFTCDQCNWMQFAEATRDLTGANQNHTWEYNAISFFERAPDLDWWPIAGVSEPFPDVPEHIAEAAGEAHRCHSIQAYRGAVALARAVIEATAKAKNIKTGTLMQKIDKLEDERHVRPHVRDAAHEVRHLGNEVAHGDFVDPVTAEEAEETLALMAEVLQEVFQSPARLARAQERRKAKKAATES